MPIIRALYPHDWPAISRRIRFERAGGKCEGSPAYPDCRAEHGKPHPVTGKIVYLQTAHYPDPSPSNSSDANLRCWCPRCHNATDARLRVQIRRRRHQTRQRRQAGQMALPTAWARQRHRDLTAQDVAELEAAWISLDDVAGLDDGVDRFEAGMVGGPL